MKKFKWIKPVDIRQVESGVKHNPFTEPLWDLIFPIEGYDHSRNKFII